MDDTDAFFTHTIVGPPVSVLLGCQQDASRHVAQGLDVDLISGHARLSTLWHEWVLLGHGTTPTGRPRRRPGVWRRRLERHALWLALLGVLSLMLSVVLLFISLSGLQPVA
jgi:hypothetical protein